MTKADLVDALKSLATSQAAAAERQAVVAEKQAEATASNFKSPILPVPVFNPMESRNDPFAWTTFWSKFELFSENCVDTPLWKGSKIIYNSQTMRHGGFERGHSKC